MKPTDLVGEWLNLVLFTEKREHASVDKIRAEQMQRHAVGPRCRANVSREDVTDHIACQVSIEALVEVLNCIAQVAASEWTGFGHAESCPQLLATRFVSLPNWPQVAGKSGALNYDVLQVVE